MAETENSPNENRAATENNATKKWYDRPLSELFRPAWRQLALLIVAFVFVFHGGTALRGVQGWFQDIGRFYDPSNEGLIVVDSPQLFTRERLINQRLDDSVWMDNRIKAVDKMIEEGRFLKYSSLRSENDSIEVGNNKGTNTDPKTKEQTGEQPDVVQLDPLEEFAAAKDYRQRLIHEKYEAVLDDAHDTDSNTLQRLNFNLTISPGRKHSTSVAAVSVTLQQPDDPEWILQNYGELLVDVRKELQLTAQRMIEDRMSILSPTEGYMLPAETESLLRDLVSTGQSLFGQANEISVAAAEGILRDQYTRNIEGSFQTQLKAVAPGAGIGELLIGLFFSSAPPATQTVNDKTLSVRTASAKNGPSTQTGQPPQRPDLRTMAMEQLRGRCLPAGKPVSIWSLLPAKFADHPDYGRLKKAVSSHPAFVEAHFNRLGVAKDDVARVKNDEEALLRKLLTEATVSVRCDQNATRIAQQAMLLTLGRLALPIEKHPAYMASCFTPRDAKNSNSPSKETDGLNPAQKARICHHLRNDLLHIGVVKLVHAELISTPIDTVGRVRHLLDYFDVSTDKCDLGSCKIVVRTISEKVRDEKIEKELRTILRNEMIKKDNAESAQAFIHNQMDKMREEALLNGRREALEVGRREALRLFAELSCFANARSYTVYPRRAVGKNRKRNDNQDRSVSWLSGVTNAVFSSSAEQTDVERDSLVYGIGDAGKRTDRGELNCGPSFYHILNSFNVKQDVTEKLKSNLEKGSEAGKLDLNWRYVVACLLNVETNRMLHSTEKAGERDNCLATHQAGVPTEPVKVDEFELSHLTSVVRFLRGKKTTISWIVQPEDMGTSGTKHRPRSVPLSALISLPSWWPGVDIIVETCWKRPKDVSFNSGRSLCDGQDKARLIRSGLFDPPVQVPGYGGDTPKKQILPLPYNIEDVLPKLGFFLIRYPYLDKFPPSHITLESGREVKLRLTGKRLWKNPMVRIGEQWHSRIEVLPDMMGIVATFECLEPLSQSRRQHTERPQVVMVNAMTKVMGDRPLTKDKAENVVFDFNPLLELEDSKTATQNERDHAELRPVQVWTSEGKTGPVSITVKSFRPNFGVNGTLEEPCWVRDYKNKYRDDEKQKPANKQEKLAGTE